MLVTQSWNGMGKERKCFTGNISVREGDNMLVTVHGKLEGWRGKCTSSTKQRNELKGEAKMVGIRTCAQHLLASANRQLTDCFRHTHALPFHKCDGLPWRMEEGDRAKGRESKHRGLDCAIYKAWPSACLINCALFWESRKPAGLKERRRQSQKKRKKYKQSLFSLFPDDTDGCWDGH